MKNELLPLIYDIVIVYYLGDDSNLYIIEVQYIVNKTFEIVIKPVKDVLIPNCNFMRNNKMFSLITIKTESNTWTIAPNKSKVLESLNENKDFKFWYENFPVSNHY